MLSNRCSSLRRLQGYQQPAQQHRTCICICRLLLCPLPSRAHRKGRHLPLTRQMPLDRIVALQASHIYRAFWTTSKVLRNA